MMNLEVYPCLDSFIGKFVLPSEADQSGKKCDQVGDASNVSGATQTVVILDRSGSMAGEVRRVTTKLLPAVFRKLRYKEDDRIVLITFDSCGSCEEYCVGELAGLPIDSRGCTEMSTGLQELIDYFPKLLPNLPLRIFIISDGEVSDKAAVLSMSDTLSEMFRSAGFAINAQGFRWFTSSCQPDTKALASVLKFNTTNAVMLQDVSTSLSDSELVDILVNPYITDNLDKSQILQSRSKADIMLQYPWQNAATSEIFVRPGENIFWLSAPPQDGDICLTTTFQNTQNTQDAEPVNIPVILRDPLTSANYVDVMFKKMNYYLDHLKLLKVNETNASAVDISKILSYFTSLEKAFEKADEEEVVPGAESLKAAMRLDLLQKLVIKRERSIINKMKEIANDDRISRLSAQQTADYLRKDLPNDKNMKGLASRIGDDLDFTGAARSEIRAMHEHLSELSDVDDSTHAVSFLDLETTLTGIRTACELVDRTVSSGESLLDSVSCTDILRLLNIVGIACKAPVGTFPDAMTWRVDKLFLGTFCSVSDIVTHSEIGSELLVPRGFENEGLEITNVIPYFEDVKILRFLKKYASKLLELSAGEGMRRLLGGVNGTFLYTICGGLLQLVSQLNTIRSELYLNTLIHVVETFTIQSGGYFDHILPYLHDQEETEKLNLSYFLSNNGMTNMMYPILQILISSPKYLKATNRESGDNTSIPSKYSIKLMPRILRSVYSYEIWQAVKRTFKNQDNAHILIKDALLDLLGVDLINRKTALSPLFEKEPEKVIFYDKYHINESALDEFIKAFWYLDSMVLIPPFLEAASKHDMEALKRVPALSDTYVLQSCDVPYDIRTFRFYNIVQALMFSTKAMRVDDGCDGVVTEKAVESSGQGGVKSVAQKGAVDSKVMNKETEDNIAASENMVEGDKIEKEKEEQEVIPEYMSKRMRIIDLKNQDAVESMVRDFVMKQYADQYQSDLAFKGKEERKELKDQLIQRITASTTHEETVYLFRQGVTHGTYKCQILNSSSYGFMDLKRALLDLQCEVHRRLETLRLLLLGVDEQGEVVWNEGKALFCMDLTEYEAVFLALNRPEIWAVIRAEHRVKNMFEYNREKRNRHTHGRDRPSYYAMGYRTLEHLIGAVASNEITMNDLVLYCKEHSSCCGVKRITKNRYSSLESAYAVRCDDSEQISAEDSVVVVPLLLLA
jgi:hypothetical protein